MSFEIPRKPILEVMGNQLPGPCLGAAFTTYSLDLKFFEEKVLPPLLNLSRDPQEETLRFLEEARERIQQVPVVVVADGGQITGARRIPFDLLEVHTRTFHPKLHLLLFEGQARLVIGSGNLTLNGFGGYTELFVVQDLSYSQPAHRVLLAQVRTYLQQLQSLVRSRGTQLGAFLEQLLRLCPELATAEPVVTAAELPDLLHTANGEPLLDQLLSRLPEGARLERVGVLAPFYEEDDEAVEASVLHRLRERAEVGGGRAIFDIGLPWDENPLAPPEGALPPLEERLGELWARRSKHESGKLLVDHMEYLVPTRITPRRVYYRSQWGKDSQADREPFESALSERQLWPVGEIRTFGPANLLAALREVCGECTLWLFPAQRIERGKPEARPLHAKLLVLGVREEKKVVTYVLMGSANISRRALLLPLPQANVEAGLLFRVEQELTLSDLAPQLVYCPGTQLSLQERSYPAKGKNPALIVRRAAYHAREQRLEVEWDAAHSPGEIFQLIYPLAPEQILFEGSEPPDSSSSWSPFTLELSSAELHVCTSQGRYAVQIEVVDLAALPANPLAHSFDFEELLQHYGGRWGTERLWRERIRRAAGVGQEKAESQGDTPTHPADVFRAWFGLQAALGDTRLTVGGMAALIDGPTGVRALWQAMKDAIARGKLSREEVWLYGLELHRTLAMLQWEENPVAQDRKALLATFLQDMRRDMTELAPSEAQLPALSDIHRFYGMEVAA